jgi:predicted dehydrogenase
MREKPFSFIVVGCGSIGRRHIGNLLSLRAGSVVAVDDREDRRREVSERFGIRVHSRFDQAVPSGPSAAVICTPTRSHVPHAMAAVRRGCHLFIEKPVSHSSAGLAALIRAAERKKLRSLVGCNFRFHPGLRFIRALLEKRELGRVVSVSARFGQYLPDWRPLEDYRKSYSASRRLGGGVILDRIHELDYLRWLFGPVQSVYASAGRFSGLKIDTEDVAEMVLSFRSGLIGTVHLDYVRREYDCSLEIIGTEGIARWTFQTHTVDLYAARTRQWRQKKWKGGVNNMYVDEMKHFMSVVAGREPSEQDLSAAATVLRVALAARESARSGRRVRI